MVKKCGKCGESKDTIDFHKDIRNKDGLTRWCKSCRSTYNKTKCISNKTNHDIELGHSETKQCGKCGAYKSVSEFYKDYRSGDGITSWCKSCRSQQQKLYKHGKVIKERLVEKYGEVSITLADYSQIKQCTVCGETKTLSFFNFKNKGKHKFKSLCKDCDREKANRYNLERKIRKIRAGEILW